MVRTRFAPSPTGYLHIGGLRTALYAYLFAKKAGGSFILRIEDTDLERQVEGAEQQIYNSLKDAGLIYDEGPDVGGDFAPYIQSHRKQIYQKYAHELVERGGAYYCFCSKERLSEIRSKGATKYDKHCLSIPLEQARERIASGEPFVIRQNIPKSGVSSYEDLVFGRISVDYNDLEDGVLLKSDGMPTYNFANIVDDHLMGITHVIRGTEYLSSTPKYNLMYTAFGWEIPKYIHLQPIMKNEREKLSKRHGAASYEDFIAKGYLKEAVINYIALLGWSPKEDREKFSFEELKERFDLHGISKSHSIFDENKLRWLNGCYIKELSVEQFHELAVEWYDKLPRLKGMDYRLLSTLLHSRVETLADIEGLTAFIDEFEGFDLELFVNQKNKTDREMAKTMLNQLLPVLESKKSFDGLFETLMEFAVENGYKKGQVLWIFRIAITGHASTPGGATEMAQLLGLEKALERIRSVLKRVE